MFPSRFDYDEDVTVEELNVGQYKAAKELLKDTFIRRVVDVANGLIMSTNIELEIVSDKETIVLNNLDVDARFRPIMDDALEQMWIGGFIFLIFDGINVKVITEGIGEWWHIWIVTYKRTGKRIYKVIYRSETGSLENLKEDAFMIFDNFVSRPNYDGQLNSILHNLAPLYKFHQNQKMYEDSASYNTSRPPIVVEHDPKAFGELRFGDLVTGRYAGWTPDEALESVGEGGQYNEFEYTRSTEDIKNSLKILNTLYEKTFETNEGYTLYNFDPSKDQTLGAIRPIPIGKKVAPIHNATIRRDAIDVEIMFQILVSNAFGLDRSLIISSDRTKYASRVDYAERTTMRTVNVIRNYMTAFLSRVFVFGSLYYLLTEDELRTIAELGLQYRVIVRNTAPFTLEELKTFADYGVINREKDFIPMARALLGGHVTSLT